MYEEYTAVCLPESFAGRDAVWTYTVNLSKEATFRRILSGSAIKLSVRNHKVISEQFSLSLCLLFKISSGYFMSIKIIQDDALGNKCKKPSISG